MKRLLLALILLLPRLVSAQTEGELRVQRGGTCERPVMAMNRDSLGLDTLRRIDTVGNDLMALRGAGREGNVILEVAGFGITLGRAPEPEYADVVTRSGRVKLYLFNCGEFGFSQLVGVDYDGYAPEEKGFLDQKLGSSIHVAASVLQVQVALNRNRTFYFATDLNFAVDNYRLSDAHIRLGYEHGRLLPVALDEPADKSKFVTSSLGIPLRLIYKPFRNFQVSAIAYSDFGIELTSLHKKPKVQYELSGLRTYQFGVGGAVSYSGVGVFVRYGVTPLFKKGGGPECHTLSSAFRCSCNYNHGIHETIVIDICPLPLPAAVCIGAEQLRGRFLPAVRCLRRIYQRAAGAEDDADDEPSGRAKGG